jgi:hypothetical protein
VQITFVELGLIVGGILIGLLLGWLTKQRLSRASVIGIGHKVALPNLAQAAGNLDQLVGSLVGVSRGREVLAATGHWLHQTANVPLVVLYEFDGARSQLVSPVIIGGKLPTLPDTLKLGTLVYGQVAADVLRNRATSRYVESIARDVYFGPSLPNLKSAYLMPLLHNSVFFGVVGLHLETTTFSDTERAFYDRVATITAMNLYSATGRCPTSARPL